MDMRGETPMTANKRKIMGGRKTRRHEIRERERE
jgi:hypothetical protein